MSLMLRNVFYFWSSTLF